MRCCPRAGCRLIFGVQALVLVAVTTLACVAFEYLYEMLLKKPNTAGICLPLSPASFWH